MANIVNTASGLLAQWVRTALQSTECLSLQARSNCPQTISLVCSKVSVKVVETQCCSGLRRAIGCVPASRMSLHAYGSFHKQAHTKAGWVLNLYLAQLPPSCGSF